MSHHAPEKNTLIAPLRCEIVDKATLLPMVGDITGQISAYALGAYAQKEALPWVRRMIDVDTKFLQLPYIKPWKYSNQEVIYGGIFFMHWGHFLLEDLQRLWYAKEKNIPIVWVGVNGFSHTPSQFKSWQNEIFQSLGICNEHIFLNEPTQFAKVHFPEPGSGINTHIHPQQAQFLGYHEEEPIAGKYVYFSRAKIRGCTNEESLEVLLKKRGWQIVYPEDLSVAQQLKAMSSAKVCFMIGGSAQHTLLLTKNVQTRFIVIPREHTETFNIIANSKSDNYFLFHLKKTVLYSDHKDEANDLFTLDLQILEDILNKTDDFTKDIDIFPQLFTRPEALSQKQCVVPEIYETPLPALTQGQKLFYHAYFLYKQKKYRTAFIIFTHLAEKGLLEEFMYVDFFKAIQQYHLHGGVSITLPLKKYHHQVQRLQEKIASTPQHTASYKKLTELYMIAGNFSAALHTQELLSQRNPEWSSPIVKIAHIYSMQNKLEKALEYAKKAVKIEPHNLEYKSELVQYLLARKDFDAAKKLLTQTLLHNPSWGDAYMHLATIHHAQGNLDKALACIQKTVEIAPTNIEAQERLSAYLQQAGQQAQAIQVLAKALQDNPRHAVRYAQNARFFAHKGDLDKAIDYARKAVEMEPRNFVCKTYLAEYLVKNKNYAAAEELMTEAKHTNPFWSEPHAQYAAMYAAQGELDTAIDYARKAVAVEPFDSQRKKELQKYRSQKAQSYTGPSLPRILSTTWHRIQSYIDMFYAKTYLEIGVENGNTFLNLDVPFKMGVDPAFLFDTSLYANPNAFFYPETSDVFFEKLPERIAPLQGLYHNRPFKFDVIFIDGLHTFEQTLRDFENSLAYAHEDTIWIIDDTVPCHHFSAMDNREKSNLWKQCAGLASEPIWHGDVFKAIFAIHHLYPEFSYCTQTNNANPQTIIWRTKEPTHREKVFANIEEIARMRYEDFVEHAWIMHPVNDTEVLEKIFTAIDPFEHKTGEEYKKVIKPFVTDQERACKKRNKELEKNEIDLLKKQESILIELHAAKEELIRMSENNTALLVENAVLKKKLLA